MFRILVSGGRRKEEALETAKKRDRPRKESDEKVQPTSGFGPPSCRTEGKRANHSPKAPSHPNWEVITANF